MKILVREQEESKRSKRKQEISQELIHKKEIYSLCIQFCKKERKKESKIKGDVWILKEGKGETKKNTKLGLKERKRVIQ